MKIFRKIFICLLLMFITLEGVKGLTLSTTSFDATSYSKNKVVDVTTGKALDFEYNKYYHLQTTDGKYVYCTQHDVSIGTTDYSGAKETKDFNTKKACGIVKALYDGSITKSTIDSANKNGNIQDYIKIQDLVWAYEHYEGSCDEYTSKVTALSAGTISLNKISDLSLKNDYYVGVFEVTPNNYIKSYELSISNVDGAIITEDESSTENISTTLTGKKTLYVKIPKSEVSEALSFDVSVVGNYDKEIVEKYSVTLFHYSKSGTQNLASTDVSVENSTNTGSVSDKINFGIGTISITKKDIANEQELEEAHITIYNENGDVVEDFYSTNEAHSFVLEPGIYTLEEVASPEGYEKLDTIFTFEVLENNEINLISTSKYIESDKNNIILYNEPVVIIPVPDTGKSKNLFYVFFSIAFVGCGSIIIYIAKKRITK